MLRSVKYAILFLVLLALVLVVANVAAEVKKGANEMVLYGGSLGNVPFPHHRHQAALTDCLSCHHLFPQTAGAIQDLNRQDKLKKKEVMNQCTRCHKELAAAAQKSGPVKCKDCHQKH